MSVCQTRLKLSWKVNECKPLERGCQWDSSTCSAAAKGGHLEVLKWARQHDCPWNSMTSKYAAQGGHLEVLKWAREHDCHLNLCPVAARFGHLEVLKWAVEQGCPCDNYSTCRNALLSGDEETLMWMREEGIFDGYDPHHNDGYDSDDVYSFFGDGYSDDGYSDDEYWGDDLGIED